MDWGSRLVLSSSAQIELEPPHFSEGDDVLATQLADSSPDKCEVPSPTLPGTLPLPSSSCARALLNS